VGTISIIAIAACLLQVTVAVYTRRAFPTFDLPLIVLVFFSFRSGTRRGFALGIVVGIVNAFFTIAPFWLTVFLYAGIGAAVGAVSRWFYRESLFAFIFLVACSGLFLYLVGAFIGPAHPFANIGIADYLGRLILPAALYNALASLFIFYFLKAMRV